MQAEVTKSMNGLGLNYKGSFRFNQNPKCKDLVQCSIPSPLWVITQLTTDATHAKNYYKHNDYPKRKQVSIPIKEKKKKRLAHFFRVSEKKMKELKISKWFGLCRWVERSSGVANRTLSTKGNLLLPLNGVYLAGTFEFQRGDRNSSWTCTQLNLAFIPHGRQVTTNITHNMCFTQSSWTK